MVADGSLRADQLRLVRLAELCVLPRHGVERVGQTAQLVVRSDGHDLVQVARADGRCRFRHGADGDRAYRADHQENRQNT